MNRKDTLVTAAACIAAAAAVTGFAAGAVTETAKRPHVLLARTSGALRVVLQAEPVADADAATVVVAAFEKRGDRWLKRGAAVVASRGAFSWSALQQRDGVRLLSFSGKDLRLAFELRISEAVGWSNPYVYRLQNGRLVGGVKGCGCAPQN